MLDFCGGRCEKNPRCSPATGISRKKETNYTLIVPTFDRMSVKLRGKTPPTAGGQRGCWEGKFGTPKTVATFDSMSNKLRKKQLKNQLKMARKEVENLKLKRAADKQIYDLLLNHQVKSG